jgi:hypothetical protein
VAADYLAQRFGSPGRLDMSGVVAIVPGARSGRRLLEILVGRAEEGKVAFHPPRIETPGRLPELFYQPKFPFANALTQQLAWMEAVRRFDPARLKQILSVLPQETDLLAWLSLGEMLARLHRELAAEGLDFADVAEKGTKLAEFREAPRWRTLAEIQQNYLNILDRLEVWDVQTARRVAVEHAECRTDMDIVLIGLADMNRSLRQMLDQVSSHVTALVLAPPELADRFDPYGCLALAPWLEATMDLADHQIELVDDPADQSQAAVRAIAALGGGYRGEQITLGVPDTRILPYLQQHLRQAGVPPRYGIGMPVAQTGPCRLLTEAVGYLEDHQFSSLAVLLRHPAIHEWLERTATGEDYLTWLDQYYSRYLPHDLDKTAGSRERGAGIGEQGGLLRDVWERVDNLLARFDGEKRPLEMWGPAILDLLAGVYGNRKLDREKEEDRIVLEVCDAIREVLEEHRAIPDSIAPNVGGVEAIHLVLQELEERSVPAMPDRNAVELLGWLELPLDDAPVLIVTGFNEGIVPQHLNADLFLPNQLRLALGLEDNDRRYVRDAYALNVLTASRERLKIIVGRRTAQGDPLIPSRLLFACDRETLAGRSLKLFSTADSVGRPGPLPGALRPGQTVSTFGPPRPQRLVKPVTAMRVTEFRDYIACPYRYYLRHRLGLRSLGDAAEELDWGQFGTLAHDVLREFGESEAADSQNPEEISAHLSAGLDRQVAGCYGASPLAAVRVQVEQLRRRLSAFATWQAGWRREGWRIEHVEVSPAEEAFLMVDGEKTVLKGRIDRIDIHTGTGERIVVDYKTSETAQTPDAKHRKNGEWTDLQLPLYRHLTAGLGIEGKVRLGYLVLPKDFNGVAFLPAEWSDEDLAGADRKAEEIVRAVRAETFWPPAAPPPDFFEEFAAICQDNRFGFLRLPDEEGDAA